MDTQHTHISLFSAGDDFLLCKGIYQRVKGSLSQGDLVTKINQALANAANDGLDNPIVIGAIPFHSEQQCNLIIPLQYQKLNQQQVLELFNKNKKDYQVVSQQEVPSQTEFCHAVEQALAKFARGSLEKVVLSRTLQVELDTHIEPQQIVSQLIEQNPKVYHFLIPTENHGYLLGASPELLLEKQADSVISHPLAGTIKRSQDPIECEQNYRYLQNSEKDLHEHSYVANQIGKALGPYCNTLAVPEVPSIVATANLWHLASRIEGQLESEQIHIIDLLNAVHPTPAICGTPTALAHQTINELEPFDRGLFTGSVGWCDLQGNGQWAVTIRCAELSGNKLCLYAGAGIVPASTPLAEYQETGAKLQTFLNALNP
ncbi:isochorismate synthase [Catenovulum agarivorans]|uniref:isochorismate synthase n=1 Tax=Catenovulum agarivorans TaxID=1172192 RepID=UPI00031A1B6E|nr:isochorismate synthase [Catenovulum agarivorans]